MSGGKKNKNLKQNKIISTKYNNNIIRIYGIKSTIIFTMKITAKQIVKDHQFKDRSHLLVTTKNE